jgi:hypothetical protein
MSSNLKINKMKKLKLKNIKIESFITLINEKETQTIKGGVLSVSTIYIMSFARPELCSPQKPVNEPIPWSLVVGEGEQDGPPYCV